MVAKEEGFQVSKGGSLLWEVVEDLEKKEKNWSSKHKVKEEASESESQADDVSEGSIVRVITWMVEARGRLKAIGMTSRERNLILGDSGLERRCKFNRWRMSARRRWQADFGCRQNGREGRKVMDNWCIEGRGWIRQVPCKLIRLFP